MVLYNFVPISSGGGLQNSLSFLENFSKKKEVFGRNYIIFCTKGGKIESFCEHEKLYYYSVKGGIFGRVWYELCLGYYLIKKFKVRLVFSLFGGAPMFSPKVYKISGFAYSNIIQHEVPFWSFLSLYPRIKKEIIDILRLRLALSSNELIVETDYLADRARKGVFSGKKVHVVKMSPSSVVLNGLVERVKKNETVKTIDILYLSGPHPNKRIHQLNDIFAVLNKDELRYRLITTLPEDSLYLKVVQEGFARKKINGALFNLGPISPNHVGNLLGHVDAMINVALLESFSNNWVEAWAADLPLIVSDADWARHSCGNAAIYVDIDDPVNAASKISIFFESEEMIENQRLASIAQLTSLPKPEERFGQYMKLINDALNRQDTNQ